MIDFRSVDRTRLYGSTSGAVSVTVQSAVITVPSSYTTRSGPSGRSASRNSPLCSSLVRDRASSNTRLDSCSGVIEVPSRMLAIVGRRVQTRSTRRHIPTGTAQSFSLARLADPNSSRGRTDPRGDAVPSGFGPRCRRRSGASFGCVTSCHLDGSAERPHLWWWTRRVCYLTGREDPTRPRAESKVATGGAANANLGDRQRGQALGSGYLEVVA